MKAAGLFAATLVVLWLTAPALVSPASVAAAIRSEDSLHTALLGEVAGQGILERALQWLGHADHATRDVVPPDPAPADPLSIRLAAAADAVLQIPYVQGLRAVGRLAVYRLAALAEWFALGLPLLLAAVIDGALMRTVKTRSFVHLSPVLFGIGLHGTITVVVCIVFALLAPIALHPVVWAALVAAFGVALRTAVSNFHRLR
jgi:hypothetical protein